MKNLVFGIAFIFSISLYGQNNLVIPPVIEGKVFNLTIQNGVTQFFPSINTPTFGINGALLAPTLVLNKWDTVTMNVTNSLSGSGNSTTIHWHGLHVPPEDDGGPHQLIMQNTTWSPEFQILNDAGTYWYHPHGEGKTDLHVSKGIAGIIIVKDSAEAQLNLPRTYGEDDFPIILQTKSFDVLNQIAVSTAFDTVPMVNGIVDAVVDFPAQVVRMRLLNGASERTFLLGFSNNMNFHLIATDGGLIEAPIEMNRLRLSNGERAEILVDLSALQSQNVVLMSYGSELPNGIMGADSVGDSENMIHDYYDNFLNGTDFNLLSINVVSPTSNPVTIIPTYLVNQNFLTLVNATVQRKFDFDTLSEEFTMPNLAEGPFSFNRRFFEMDFVNETVYLNTTEVWTLFNKTMVAHPFHIHDVQFYVIDINGIPTPDYMKGQKDVVLVTPGDSVRFITKFEHFANVEIPYMYHCHLLHHEDDGMMGQFRVVPEDWVNGKSEEVSTINNFRVVPNPSHGQVRFEFDDGRKASVFVYNSLGKKILDASSVDGNIDISSLSSGVYFAKAFYQEGGSDKAVFILE